MSRIGAANLPGLKKSIQKTAEKDKETESVVITGEKRKRSTSNDPSGRLTRSGRNKLARSEVATSASPILRMNPECPEEGETFSVSPRKDKPLTIGLFEKFMEEKVTGAMARLSSDLAERMDHMTERVDTNSQEIEHIKKSLKILTNERNGAQPKSYNAKKYDLSRRSLRMWPIKGKSESEMWSGVGSFIHDTLKVPELEVCQEHIEDIRRLRSPRGRNHIHNEMLVIFNDPEIRDLVSGYARNLSEHFDINGKPTAGIRTDVPFHLRQTYKMLDDHGFALRKRYGEGFKRHIKFDDIKKSFFLNVKLPETDQWEVLSADFVQQIATEAESSTETLRNFGQPRSGISTIPSTNATMSRIEQSSSESGSSDSGFLRRPRWGAPKRK